MVDPNVLHDVLAQEAEALTAEGRTPTRFEVLKIMDNWGIQLSRDSVEMAERLYAEGHVKE